MVDENTAQHSVQRAPDWWESARFQAVFVTSSWFRQSGVVSSHPPAGTHTVRPWKYREESTMSNEQVAPETKGVTVKLLTTVDLGPEIEGMVGRQLRMRMVTIEPGGVFGPIHDH